MSAMRVSWESSDKTCVAEMAASRVVDEVVGDVFCVVLAKGCHGRGRRGGRNRSMQIAPSVGRIPQKSVSSSANGRKVEGA